MTRYELRTSGVGRLCQLRHDLTTYLPPYLPPYVPTSLRTYLPMYLPTYVPTWCRNLLILMEAGYDKFCHLISVIFQAHAALMDTGKIYLPQTNKLARWTTPNFCFLPNTNVAG